MDYLSAETRYMRDPVFRQLVDIMEHEIEVLHLTPTELREAAMLGKVIVHSTERLLKITQAR
jgi:hypothetical protein